MRFRLDFSIITHRPAPVQDSDVLANLPVNKEQPTPPANAHFDDKNEMTVRMYLSEVSPLGQKIVQITEDGEMARAIVSSENDGPPPSAAPASLPSKDNRAAGTLPKNQAPASLSSPMLCATGAGTQSENQGPAPLTSPTPSLDDNALLKDNQNAHSAASSLPVSLYLNRHAF